MTGPARIQRRRTAGWTMPRGAAYVGRPGPWGNPVRTDRTTGWWTEADGTLRTIPERTLMPAEAVVQYRRRNGEGWNPERWTRFRERARQHLAGLDLACWCPLDQPCHADVLLELANTTPQTGDAMPTAPMPPEQIRDVELRAVAARPDEPAATAREALALIRAVRDLDAKTSSYERQAGSVRALARDWSQSPDLSVAAAGRILAAVMDGRRGALAGLI